MGETINWFPFPRHWLDLSFFAKYAGTSCKKITSYAKFMLLFRFLTTYLLAIPKRIRLLAVLCLLCIQSPLLAEITAEKLAEVTIVVYNRQSPGSEDLANYYAKKRGIPAEQVIGLNCPLAEEISRAEFDATIANPLGQELVRRKCWIAAGKEVKASRIRYVALIRGMPLKIATSLPPPAPGELRDIVKDRDEASVDSELAVLGVPHQAKGPLNNPLFRNAASALEAPFPPGMLLVCRLDAPDDQTVKRMIDDGIKAERRGLWGWGYADLRGLTAGPYYEGDQWIENAVSGLRNQGVPVLTERTEATLPTGFPVRQAAVYYGWYATHANGPFVEDSTTFAPGAIAVHIHSYSASTLRNPTVGWAGPLLLRGATVTAGNVYEPYLALTLNLDIFQDRLMMGLCVADANYAAIKVLSWMNVVVGDPLYRPYLSWQNLSINAKGAGNEWEQYRNTVLANADKMTVAAPFLATLGKKLHNPMPAESVGCWQLDRKDYAGAIKSLRDARNLTTEPWQRLQIDCLLIRAFEEQGKKADAAKVIKGTLLEDLTPAQQNLMKQTQDRLFPPPPPPPPAPLVKPSPSR